MNKLETTLLLCKQDQQILLAMKKRGFLKDKWNGVGGKLSPDETPEQAMLRETQEEIGIIPTIYEKIGIIDFLEYFKGEKIQLIMHLFVAKSWKGEPKETDEMRPQWFDINKLPYELMMPDDKYWMPYVLKGKKINAHFDFDENWNLLSYKIEELK